VAKRKNRLKPLEHEGRQLENLKTLEPNTTPPALRPLSAALVDLAALGEVEALETGKPPALDRLQHEYERVRRMAMGVELSDLIDSPKRKKRPPQGRAQS
jgi:hypothetical protein